MTDIRYRISEDREETQLLTSDIRSLTSELRDARAQQIVEMHDADRAAGVDHHERGYIRRVEQFERLADQLIGTHRLRPRRHDVLDPGVEQVGPHVPA